MRFANLSAGDLEKVMARDALMDRLLHLHGMIDWVTCAGCGQLAAIGWGEVWARDDSRLWHDACWEARDVWMLVPEGEGS